MTRFELQAGESADLLLFAKGCEAMRLVVRCRSATGTRTLVEHRHSLQSGGERVRHPLEYDELEGATALEVDATLYGHEGANYSLQAELRSRYARAVALNAEGMLGRSRISSEPGVTGSDAALLTFDLDIRKPPAAKFSGKEEVAGLPPAARAPAVPPLELDERADFPLGGGAAPAPPPPPDKNTKKNYPVWYATNRVPILSGGTLVGYSGDRDQLVHHGRCIVRIPKSHDIGEVGSPFWKRLITFSDDRLKLVEVLALEGDAFWKGVADQLREARVGHRHAVVFIHGYNVSFEEAAIRAAQIGCDLSIEGTMAFYSWPSRGSVDGYFADEATIQYSAKYITEFLEQIAEIVDAEKVHVIAHSMGNRAVYEAVREIVDRAQARKRVPFSQFILAAPDVDADYFKQFANAYGRVAKRATMYVSDRDRAVKASRFLHGGEARVGLAPPFHLLDGIDTVFAGEVDDSLLGHGYVASQKSLLNDMHQMIHLDAEPSKRSWVERSESDDYWVLKG